MLCFFFSLSPQPFFPVSFCFCFDPLILLIFSSLLILSLLVEMRKQRCINRAVRASDNATPSLSLPTPTLPFAFEKKMCINESQGTLVVYRPTLKINKYLHARKREHAFPLQPGQYQSHQPGRAFWNSHLRTRWADLRPRCSSRAGAAWLASSVLIWAGRGTFDQRRSQPASFPSWVRRLQKSYKADYNPGLPVSAPAPWVLIQPPDFPHCPLVPALCSHSKPCGRLQGTRLRLICRDVEEDLSLNACWPKAGCEKPSLLGKSIPGRLLFKSVSSTDWQWSEILIHKLQQNS